MHGCHLPRSPVAATVSSRALVVLSAAFRSSRPLLSCASPTDLRCEHFDSCPGCTIKSGLHEPPLMDEARSFFAERGVGLRAVGGDVHGWRTTAKLAVRASESGPSIGLFARGTHDVVRVPRCSVHHPAINAAVAAVDRELRSFGELSAFDEAAHRGTLRYLQATVERCTGRVQLTLVANAEGPDDDPALRQFGLRLWAMHGGGSSDGSGTYRPSGDAMLHSVWLNCNPSRKNNIFSFESGAWHLVAGEAELRESMASGAQLVFNPYVFRQANLEGFDKIVAAIRDALPSGARLVEWYAGAGALGLSVAPRCEWVRCSDVIPPHETFESSRALLPRRVRERIKYAVGSSAELINDASGADVALVDPPRKGLDPRLLSALAEPASARGPCSGLRMLVYVSCGFPALRRDADALLKAGWRVRGGQVEAHVLFPGSNHIETLAIFERA